MPGPIARCCPFVELAVCNLASNTGCLRQVTDYSTFAKLARHTGSAWRKRPEIRGDTTAPRAVSARERVIGPRTQADWSLAYQP
jgi:hypothetical protein